MPTKQEIINMMENSLPGEPTSSSTTQRMPPDYSVDRPVYNSYTDNSIYAAPLTNNSTNTNATIYGSHSLLTKCHTCGRRQLTRLEYENGLMTHIIAAILCLTTCCGCLPYCFKSCKVTRHYCSTCGSYLGSNSKIQMPQIVILGPEAQQLQCPRCRREITTYIKGRSTIVTHLIALILTIVWYLQ
uniref:LITAF domain-containing protein n=1 Tax=Glossina brevipalpis TaxID=37001 RepID=A0A1A9X504_9MUSC